MTITPAQAERVCRTLLELWADQHKMSVNILSLHPVREGEKPGITWRKETP